MGAIGSLVCPPLAVAGMIGSAIGAIGSGIASIVEEIFDWSSLYLKNQF